jgi:hypothetical protein
MPLCKLSEVWWGLHIVAMSNPLEECACFCVIYMQTTDLYKVNFVKCYLCAVYAGEIHPTIALLSGEASYHLSGYMDFWKNKFWCAENSMLIIGCHYMILWLMRWVLWYIKGNRALFFLRP